MSAQLVEEQKVPRVLHGGSIRAASRCLPNGSKRSKIQAEITARVKGQHVNFRIEAMREGDWPAVRRIYGEGLRTGLAAFAKTAPPWEAWDRGHLKAGRYVARDTAWGVVAWAALSAVPDT